MKLHFGEKRRFTTLPLQDHQYQSWQPPKQELKLRPRLKNQAVDKTHPGREADLRLGVQAVVMEEV
eukprot:3475162-Amphidinium_carterae.1